MKINGEGPIPTRVMVVGEFPGERDRVPFDGAAGMELNRMLHEVGIMRSECYTTYACKERPPLGQISAFVALKKKDIGPHHQIIRGLYCLPQIHQGVHELETEISMVQPNIIIAMGNLALWALTGHWGVLKWRGSQLLTDKGVKVIPTLTPGAVIREWPQRAVVLSDLRRAKRHMLTPDNYTNKPEWNFIIRPSFGQALSTLDFLITKVEQAVETWIEFDLETCIHSKQIRCVGLSWSAEDAICIPITDGYADYWEAEQETWVLYYLYKLLTHPKIKVRGQNLLFDCQYTYRYWHFIPNVAQDTMITQHSCFCALPKGLDFLASLYSDWYTNWKMEEK
jgi:uracil-DNA glycosylase